MEGKEKREEEMAEKKTRNWGCRMQDTIAGIRIRQPG